MDLRCKWDPIGCEALSRVQGKASKRVLKNQGAREIIDIKTAVRHLFLWNLRWEGLFVSSSCLLAWTRLCACVDAALRAASCDDEQR